MKSIAQSLLLLTLAPAFLTAGGPAGFVVCHGPDGRVAIEPANHQTHTDPGDVSHDGMPRRNHAPDVSSRRCVDVPVGCPTGDPV